MLLVIVGVVMLVMCVLVIRVWHRSLVTTGIVAREASGIHRWWLVARVPTGLERLRGRIQVVGLLSPARCYILLRRWWG